MTRKIELVITYKDLISQAEDEGIKLTTKRAKELMNEWASAVQGTLTEKSAEIISDCILQDADGSND
jgi:hypothetical protein